MCKPNKFFMTQKITLDVPLEYFFRAVTFYLFFLKMLEDKTTVQ